MQARHYGVGSPCPVCRKKRRGNCGSAKSPAGCLGRMSTPAAPAAAAAPAIVQQHPILPAGTAPAASAPAAVHTTAKAKPAGSEAAASVHAGAAAAKAKSYPKEYAWPVRSLGIAAQLEALASRPSQAAASQQATMPAGKRSSSGKGAHGSKQSHAGRGPAPATAAQQQGRSCGGSCAPGTRRARCTVSARRQGWMTRSVRTTPRPQKRWPASRMVRVHTAHGCHAWPAHRMLLNPGFHASSVYPAWQFPR